MIGIEFRDEDYAELVDEAKKLVKQAHHMKKTACKIIKALAAMEDEEIEDGDEEMEDAGGDEISYRHHDDGSYGNGVVYYRGKGARMRKRDRKSTRLNSSH